MLDVFIYMLNVFVWDLAISVGGFNVNLSLVIIVFSIKPRTDLPGHVGDFEK